MPGSPGSTHSGSSRRWGARRSPRSRRRPRTEPTPPAETRTAPRRRSRGPRFASRCARPRRSQASVVEDARRRGVEHPGQDPVLQLHHRDREPPLPRRPGRLQGDEAGTQHQHPRARPQQGVEAHGVVQGPQVDARTVEPRDRRPRRDPVASSSRSKPRRRPSASSSPRDAVDSLDAGAEDGLRVQARVVAHLRMNRPSCGTSCAGSTEEHARVSRPRLVADECDRRAVDASGSPRARSGRPRCSRRWPRA